MICLHRGGEAFKIDDSLVELVSVARKIIGRRPVAARPHRVGADIAAACILPAFSTWPSSVLASATISGLSADAGRVTPIHVVPPWGHSVNGYGGGVVGASGHSARRAEGAFGSVGGFSWSHSSL